MTRRLLCSLTLCVAVLGMAAVLFLVMVITWITDGFERLTR